MITIVKDDPRRVDDPQATLELNGLQFLRASRLRYNGHTFMATDRQKGHDKHSRLKTNTMTHLGAFEGVDQTVLADVREADNADGDALGRARFVRLEEGGATQAQFERRGSCADASLRSGRGVLGLCGGVRAMTVRIFSRGTKSTSACARSPA